MGNFKIRLIKEKDNQAIEQIIRKCFYEFKIPLKNTAYEDPETKQMYQSYTQENEAYYVIENEGKIWGGGGIKPLPNADVGVCELQKMYFDPQVRGKGLGKMMMNTCLDFAQKKGYKKCYLESASQLLAAIHIYKSVGFAPLQSPMGTTGHTSCGVWMIKDL